MTSDESTIATTDRELPGISIVIPAYNSERTIYKCLDSIFQSDYPSEKLEVLLIDNNSTDDTQLVAERFPAKVIVEKHQGRSYARNTGAAAAKNDYLVFLDSDVYVEKTFFHEIITILLKKGVGGVQAKIIPSDIDGQQSINNYRKRTIKASTQGTFCLLNLMVRESPMVNSAACAYRKAAFDLVGGFDIELDRHEDIDLARRVSYSGYFLASAEKARANVIYHGEGWLSYFWRSFQDGYTKIDYNRKWSLEQKWIGDEEDENFFRAVEAERENVEREKEEARAAQTISPEELGAQGLENCDEEPMETMDNSRQKFFPIFYAWWAIRDLLQALLSFFKTFDIYFLLLFINHVFKLTGRVLGPLRKKRHFAPLEIHMAPPEIRLQKIYVKKDQPYVLKPTIRFVLLKTKIYIIDIDGHHVLGEGSDYPLFYSYFNFQRFGLFKEFEGKSGEEMIFQILKFIELIKR